MSFLKKLAGETIIYGMGSILPKLLNFLVLAPYLTRVFAADAYGIHGIVYGFAGLMMVLTTFRMETAFFRFANKEGNSKSITFGTSFIAVIVVTLAWFVMILISSDSIATALNIPGKGLYIKYFAWIILFDAISALPFAKLRLENKAKRFAIIKILNVVVNVLFIWFFLELCPYLSSDGQSIVSGFYDKTKELDYVFIANLMGSITVLILLIPTILKDKLVFSKNLFNQMLRYGAPLIIVGIAAVINGMSDRYFITELRPGSPIENLTESGIYNGCLKIAVLMSLFTTAFNYAVEPFFFKQAGNKNKDVAYAKIALAFSIVSSTIFLIVMLYLDIFKYLISPDYWVGLGIVPILLLAYLLLGMFYNFSIWYKITDKTYVGAIIASIGSVIIISMNYMLIPSLGYIGAAWSVLGCYLFMTIAAYVTGQKYHKINYPMTRIFTNIVIAIGLYLTNDYLIQLLGGSIPSLVISTVLVLIFIGYIYMYQWKFLLSGNDELI